MILSGSLIKSSGKNRTSNRGLRKKPLYYFEQKFSKIWMNDSGVDNARNIDHVYFLTTFSDKKNPLCINFILTSGKKKKPSHIVKKEHKVSMWYRRYLHIAERTLRNQGIT